MNTKARPRNVLILGAAGRDFHNFNVCFRDDSTHRVKAFTAAQIPDIAGRRYPAVLAGELYPEGIPIFPEAELTRLVREEHVDEVVFSYSDVSNQTVMSLAALANAAGADFRLLGTQSTWLRSKKPVVAVCAVRTGCGKSQTSRVLADLLAAEGKRVAVVRHPMPYGDLASQRCQRFETVEDLARFHCTIEEREEYELHLQKGHLLFAGVDYGAILEAAERDADVILWDGGNNDLPFYRPDLHITLVDPHRPGHELTYYPSQANLQLADVLLVTKVGTAPRAGIEQVRKNIALYNPKARVIEADSIVEIEDPAAVAGKRVLVVEDGPTLTHGGMAFGAGFVAAQKYGAAEIVDPRPFAVGSIKATLDAFPHLKEVLPAMGYSDRQVRELGETIAAVPCDVVLVGTPFDLGRLLPQSRRPLCRVTYELDRPSRDALAEVLRSSLPAKKVANGRGRSH